MPDRVSTLECSSWLYSALLKILLNNINTFVECCIFRFQIPIILSLNIYPDPLLSGSTTTLTTMKNIWPPIRTSIAYCCPCCFPSPSDEAGDTELQALPQDAIICHPPTVPELQSLPQGTVICQPPTGPESTHSLDELFSIGSDSEPSVLDPLDEL